MEITFLKGSNDNKSFKMFEKLGAEIYNLEDLEKTDDTIKELVNKNYKTIIMTNEVASFSESIIKKYSKSNDIKIIITPGR